MNLQLISTEVQEYLAQHRETDLSSFILSGSPFEGISVQELAQQLEGLQKTRDKLPTWHATPGIFFPPKLNLEQTSGELTALHKAGLVTGDSLMDVTGGLGVDSYFFSQKINKVVYCEIDTSLANIAAHNFKKLNVRNISVHTENGIDFLARSNTQYDYIYIDPSRRNSAKSKVFILNDCEPNVPEHLDHLFQKGKKIMVKTSPLLDLKAGIEELSAVCEIHIVAVKNEVKELLFILENGSLPGEIRLFTTNIGPKETQRTSVNYQDALQNNANYTPPKRYLYEPNAALMKSGLFNWISAYYKIDKLSANTHLYTSEELIDFPGRSFKINDQIPYSKKQIAALYKNKKAHITTRNFREPVAQLRKRFKIRDGGDRYLFFTTCEDQSQWVLDCSKAEDL